MSAPAVLPPDPAATPPHAARAPRRSAPATAALASGALLLLAYVATLAPTVTFWDAGEFLAAIHSFGVPHPPGTPLYVAAARAWMLASPWLSTAVAVHLFSAACAAAACAILAWLVARWTGRGTAGIAAAVVAGSATSVWASATEAEVYSASLLLSASMLLAGWRRGGSDDARWTVLLVYLFALAVPLHLSALVAAPGAIAFATAGRTPGEAMREGTVLAAGLLAAAGAGTVSLPLFASGIVALLVAAAFWRPEARGARAMLVVGLALGLSAALILLLRARHDPAINQGNPSSLASFLYVLGRRQYDVAGLWPRQAPGWLQLGNLFQWADWQWGLGLSAYIGPSWRRTTVTVGMVALALAGSAAHRRLHRESWRAWLVLLVSASLGILVWLNLKAGPSYGWGVLPDDAPHEARERDYFFALAFWAWGAWAGLGAHALVTRLLRRTRQARWAAAGAIAAACVPLALNWQAMNRRAPVEASAARGFAAALLGGAPRDAVLFVAGDNDTYPLWYLQAVEAVRRDVTVVTLPLLGAPWYREELSRRTGLVPASLVRPWSGTPRTAAAIGAAASARRRPVAVSVGVEAELRAALGGPWILRGVRYELDRRANGREPWAPAEVDTAAARAMLSGLPHAIRVAAEGAPATPEGARPPGVREATDPTVATMVRLLGCARAAIDAGRSAAAAEFLATRCNFR